MIVIAQMCICMLFDLFPATRLSIDPSIIHLFIHQSISAPHPHTIEVMKLFAYLASSFRCLMPFLTQPCIHQVWNWP